MSEGDWLARNGGWVLLTLGVALIVTSVVIAEQQAVASVLGFSGVATAVLGVLLSRLEGAFELSPTKFAATLKSVSVRDDLTLEDKADLMFRLLGVRGDPSQSAPITASQTTTPEVGPEETAALHRPPLPTPIPFTVTGDTQDPSRVAQAFEGHVARIFEAGGWTVQQPHVPGDPDVDFYVENSGFRLGVEVRLRRRLSAADLREVIHRARVGRDISGEIVLAVNAGALSTAAREIALGTPQLLVLEFPVEGW